MKAPIILGTLLAISAFNIGATSATFAADGVDVDVTVCWEDDNEVVNCEELADLAQECHLVDPEGTVPPCNGEGWIYKRPQAQPQITSALPSQPRSAPKSMLFKRR